MKNIPILTVALLLFAFTVWGQVTNVTLEGQGNAKAVAAFRAQDSYDSNKDITVTLWTYPSGTIYLEAAPRSYILTTDDRDALTVLVQQGLHYCQVARDNTTTIDYEKDVGALNANDGAGARIIVRFLTRGWEHSGVEVRFYDRGRNTDLFLTTQEVADMAQALSAVTDSTNDYNRQVALFK